MDRLSCDRMFAAVVEAGSFAGAAQRLGTSSGQASKLVSRLESELGVRLLHRTTRALAPTEAGQAYYDRLRNLLDEFDALDAEVRDQGSEPRGTVRVTAPLTFGTLRLAGILTDFAAAHPQIGLDVSFTDRLVNLVDEGFDLAVRVGQPADSSLVARKLAEARSITVASPSYLAARGTPRTPQDLPEHDCIIDTNRRDPHRWTYAKGPVHVSGRLTFSNASVCLTVAEAGLGIACLPDFVATESLLAGRVVRLLEGHESAPLGIYAMTPSGRHLPAKVRLLSDALADALRHGR
ncbi:Transcriptional regulator, LysR family [Rubellimicrobium mesophilum DSM 19309]|uniref:Transcriptional regulator, LysR family n=1 Tax=Rubellimicrobium mesophilum DSM 19309 TaxID=442562 RepID=A0A017HLR6_9RHOB|nr:LysR family transcriptional regulator [Rubellimicrobium mesophilum]EYD75270.1 Transcriptional regulator, LysR family [Rubellimicrobium mesophilum DSM 19309]